MSTPWLHSVASSGFWTAFCKTSSGQCENSDCSDIPLHGSSGSVSSRLQWPPDPCIFSAAAIVLNLLFLFIWWIGFVRQKLGTLYSPLAYSNNKQGSNRNEEQHKHLNYVITKRTRNCFIASIILSAVVCVLHTVLGVSNLFAKWVEGFDPPLHAMVTTWISAAAWLVLTIAANSCQVEKKAKIPFLIRAWWVMAFILSLVSLVPNVLRYKKSPLLMSEACLDVASFPILVYLFVVAAFGQTGVTLMTDQDLNVPLLRDDALADEASAEEEDPGLSPYNSAGLYSIVSVSWINQVLALGWKITLELKNIPKIPVRDRSEYNYSKFNSSWENSSTFGRAVVKAFWRGAAANGAVAGANAIVSYVGPFLINDFVEYLAGRRRFAYEGVILVSIFFLAKMIENCTSRGWYMGMQHLAVHIRCALTAFVYRKGLRLSNQARQGHTTGEIINYVSVDVQRIGDFCWYMHSIWVLPIQVALALLILYKVVGIASLSALLASVFVMVANIPLARLQDTYQDKLMAAKDTRMKALTESLRSMLVLKLQAWETQYLSRIEQLRLVEYRFLKRNLLTSAGSTFVFWTAPLFVAAATFATCVFVGIPLTAGRILSALATIRVLQEPLTELPEFISMVVQTKVSLERLDKYSKEEELQEDAIVHVSKQDEAEVAIKMEGAEFKWDPSAQSATLHNINLRVLNGQRVAICGTVGSGKSSLLSSILGEITRVGGTVEVTGRTAYVSQSAWIQSGKIVDNILFGSPMDKSKYEETLRVCSLNKDMGLFAYGDDTVIGERGINMSGGQKQRIQLARAVYKDVDVYLLDDPFSAVDAHTGSDLFRDCILGALSNKTVLYVTHQVEFLPAADLILVMRDGKIVQAGQYDDLLQAGTDFNTLVNAHNEAIDLMGSSGYDEAGEENESQDSKWLDGEAYDETSHLVRQLSKKKSLTDVIPEQQKRQLVEDEERERGNISLGVYWAYLTAVYKGVLIPLIFVVQTGFQVLQIGSNYWLAAATPSTAGEPQLVDNTTLILVYCVFAFGSSICVSLRALLAVTVGMLTAQKLFMDMLRAVFRAPMSFFDSTPTGRILARASSDQNTLDNDIIYTFSGFMWTSIQLVSIIVVMSLVTWKVTLLFVPVIFVCVLMQRYYIKSARELQRLVGVLKSPIIHHYGETIAGAVTIRGFNQTDRFANTNMELYDAYGRAVFHNFAAIQWLMFRMELLSSLVFTFSLFYAVTSVGSLSPGIAGLAVTYGLTLNSIQSWVIWTWCNLENRAISVERILQFARVKSEAPVVIEESRPSPEWPKEGNVELRDLRVRYNEHSPFVLHGLTCTFASSEKIGVVGRTGSGKTTLIQTIFRIVEPTRGSIIIDGVDICTIGLHDLRNNLSIIPQEPTLFEGTMRINLDPLQRHTDSELWEVLNKCHLDEIVRTKEGKLDCSVTENGENWSVGQRQLVCLGRALLKRTSVLILDEATASVDTATDGVIQRTIRSEFHQCTVITVAHRIPTVIDSDRALVLSDGKISEYDSPKVLLKNKKSLFYKLVSEYSSRGK